MNHLKTTEDRQERWYAKHAQPRFVDPQLYSVPFSSLNESRSELSDLLRNNGFVIISNALTLEECDHALSLAMDYVHAASFAEQSLRKNSFDESTTKDKSRKNESKEDPSSLFPATVEGGILPFYGSGHSTFMWYLRTHDNIKKVFSTLHNVSPEELLTSLDGMIVWSDSNYPTDSGWFHVDQNPLKKPNFASFQGLVNLVNCSERTGGNVLVAKSHHLFPHNYTDHKYSSDVANFYETRLQEIDGDDWLEIDPNDRSILGNPENIICCLLQAGDVLLWDSRVVHCSHPPSRQHDGDKENYKECTILRGAGLVNMIPSMNVNSTTKQSRVEATKSLRTLTHWVDKASGLGDEKIKDVKKETARIDLMKSWEQKSMKQVLLSYNDLDLNQKQMI